MTLGAAQGRSQLTCWSKLLPSLDVLVSVGGFVLRWQVRRGQTRTSLTAGLTLFTTVGLLRLRHYYTLGRNLSPAARKCVRWTLALFSF